MNPLTDNFGILTAFDEIKIPPNGVSPFRPLQGAEIVTYVYRGALAQEDSTGGVRVIQAGEFQRLIIGPGIRHKETNAIRTDFARIFRISLRPSQFELDSAYEQKRFAVGQRHNLLCVIASPDGRRKSLRLLQDAVIHSSILDPGHHLIHEILPGRRAWLHLIKGEAVLQDLLLTEGDGVGVTIEPVVSITAQVETEVLLIDLGPTSKPFS